QAPLWETAARGAVVYVVLAAIIRLIPKRHAGDVSPNDLLALIIVGAVTADAMVGEVTGMVDLVAVAIVTRNPGPLDSEAFDAGERAVELAGFAVVAQDVSRDYLVPSFPGADAVHAAVAAPGARLRIERGRAHGAVKRDRRFRTQRFRDVRNMAPPDEM